MKSLNNYLTFSFLLLILSTVAWAGNATVSVLDYGALNNDTNPAATTWAFQQAFQAAAPSGKVIVPPGYYAIDNSSGGFGAAGFDGEVKFEGEAQLILQSSTQPGIVFKGGWGLRLNGMHIKYQNPPSQWITGIAALTVNGTVNARVTDTIVEGGPGFGMFFVDALEPKVINATVSGTLDDGIRFQNSRNSEISGASIFQAGQAGLDFVTAPGVGVQGGSASNITVNSSLIGIMITGTSNVTLNSFYIEQSIGSGIYCGAGQGGALPNAVSFEGGVVADSGGYGVEIGPVTSCSVANLQVLNPASIGVSVNANSGNVTIRNVRVNNNFNGSAFSIMNAGEVLLSESSASTSPGPGFFFDTVNRVVANGLTTYNVSRASSLPRAVWFQNIGNLTASNLAIGDNQPSATGYVVGDFNVARGSIQNVASNISSGSLQVQDLSHLSVLQVN